MDDQEFVAAVARSLYWGYVKDTTGVPGKWSDVDQESRKIWRALARRAIRRIDELRTTESEAK